MGRVGTTGDRQGRLAPGRHLEVIPGIGKNSFITITYLFSWTGRTGIFSKLLSSGKEYGLVATTVDGK